MFNPANDWNSDMALNIVSSEIIPPLVGFAGGKYPNCDRYLCNSNKIKWLLLKYIPTVLHMYNMYNRVKIISFLFSQFLILGNAYLKLTYC